MKKRSATKLPEPEPDALALYTLLDQTGLESTFEKFLAVTEGPSNGRCLIPVCIRLRTLFEKMPFWKDVDPFQGWDRLVDVVLDNRRELERASDHFCPKPPTGKTVKGPRSRNPMYGWIELHPFYAMLCVEQEIEDRRLDYGALQLQILHARWREAKREADKKALDPYQVLIDARDPSLRKVRDSESPAKKMRDLSNRQFGDLVKCLEPCQKPHAFASTSRRWCPGWVWGTRAVSESSIAVAFTTPGRGSAEHMLPENVALPVRNSKSSSITAAGSGE